MSAYWIKILPYGSDGRYLGQKIHVPIFVGTVWNVYHQHFIEGFDQDTKIKLLLNIGVWVYNTDPYVRHRALFLDRVYAYAEYVLNVPKNESIRDVFQRTVRLPKGAYIEWQQYTILQLAD